MSASTARWCGSPCSGGRRRRDGRWWACRCRSRSSRAARSRRRRARRARRSVRLRAHAAARATTAPSRCSRGRSSRGTGRRRSARGDTVSGRAALAARSAAETEAREVSRRDGSPRGPADARVRDPGTLRTVTGILSAAAYVPYWRLDRSEIASTFGSGGGKGQRAVASYDEDTTTMGVEAARLALRSAGGVRPIGLAVRDREPAVPRQDERQHHPRRAPARHRASARTTSVARSAPASARCVPALTTDAPILVVSADTRDGLPTSADEAGGGDGAAAILFGSDEHGPVIAEHIGVLDRDRGVHRPLAAPGRDALEAVGGAVRRDQVRAARPGGLRRRAEERGALRRPGRQAHRDRRAAPSGARADPASRRRQGEGGRRPEQHGRVDGHGAPARAPDERARDGAAR